MPLWDPYSFCGQPFLANFQSGVFYPVNLLLLPLSAEQSLGVSVWLHLVLAGWGMLLLLRSLGLSPGTALVAGLLFAVNGAMAARTGQMTMMAVPAWIPMLLYLSRRVLHGGNAIPLAVAYFCTVLAGFPPLLAWGSILLLFWSVWIWIPLARERGAAPILRVGGAFLLGTALAAVQIVPTLEFLAHSDRIRFPWMTLLSSAWHPAVLFRFLVPDLFGSPFTGDSWIHLLKRGDGHYYQSFLSTACYAGAGTLLFAFTGLPAAWRNREGRFLLTAGAVTMLLLLGTPLLRVVSVLPGLGGARVDRIVHIIMIILPVTAAFGLEHTLRKGPRRLLTASGSIVLLASLAAFWIFRRPITDALAGPQAVAAVESGRLAGRLIPAALLVAGAYLLSLFSKPLAARRLFLPLAALLLIGDAGWHARRCHVTVSREELPVETESIRFLAGQEDGGRVFRYSAAGEPGMDRILPPNLPGLFGIEDIAGYNALNIRDYRAYYRAISPESVKERRINPLRKRISLADPLLHRLSARWLMTRRLNHNGKYRPACEGKLLVYENPNAFPRAYIAPRVTRSRSAAETLRILADRSTGMDVAVFEKDPPVLPEERVTAATVGEWLSGGNKTVASFDPGTPLDGRAVIVLREPERVWVDCASRNAGVLVLADSYFPGWKAFVDGTPAPIDRVNRIFRGVVTPAGVHRVEFLYRPHSFRIGSVLSILALVFTIVLSVKALATKLLDE